MSNDEQNRSLSAAETETTADYDEEEEVIAGVRLG